MIKHSIIYTIIICSISYIHSNTTIQDVIQKWQQKLANEEKELLHEFCALRKITLDEFYAQKNYVEKLICSKTLPRIKEKAEDVLDSGQKHEISTLFKQHGFSLKENDILQHKKTSSSRAGASILSCQRCPIVITHARFWNHSEEFRKISLYHELSHLRHNDIVIKGLVNSFWDYVKEERPLHEQQKFQQLYNQLEKLDEKRADIEALFQATPEQRNEFVKQLSIDASYHTARYIITQALNNKDLTLEEHKKLTESLNYLAKSTHISAEEKILVQKSIDYIHQNKNRFLFIQQPISSQSPGYPQKKDYPSFLERVEYCTEVIKDLESAPSNHSEL